MAGVRTGLLGGTFDPPHLGHLVLAETAREQLGLEKVLFLPAGDPWRKAGRKVTTAQHRVAMTRLAIAGNASFMLDEREVRREGPTYTIDTLRELRGEMPCHELVFLAGEDTLTDMPFWREPAEIARLSQIAIAPRRDSGLPEGLPFSRESLVDIDMPFVDVSSTELRRRAGLGLSLRYLVPDAVCEYIRDHGLYSDNR
jgi:nicotinate-nucleotide adenylyltransferase